MNNKYLSKEFGFTLIELIIVIVIIGILATITAQKMTSISDTIRAEDTMQEMDMLARAIIGNPELENNGVRSDFGYVGDVGVFPSNLDALFSNPGPFSTWKGPYVKNSLEQYTDDYKKDSWGVNYIYTGGLTITSTGSGESIIRNLAGSSSEIFGNSVTGNVFDMDGTPPGNIYKDSISVRLTFQSGLGNIATVMFTIFPDEGGYFSFDSIPIGNHYLEIIYIPESDTLGYTVTVIPNSVVYGEYRLTANVWYAFDYPIFQSFGLYCIKQDSKRDWLL